MFSLAVIAFGIAGFVLVSLISLALRRKPPGSWWIGFVAASAAMIGGVVGLFVASDARKNFVDAKGVTQQLSDADPTVPLAIGGAVFVGGVIVAALLFSRVRRIAS